MASKQSTCWVIEHPEIGTAFVVADNWEQATVRAAEFWGVSWARTVSGMELVRRKDARKNICCRCGQIFHGSGDLCGACEKILRTEEDETSGGGYEVAGYGDGNGRMLFLDGRTWAALLPRRTCPRKVLALLAEHLGEIPEASAYRVSKNTGAQNQMMDMPLGTLDKLQREVAEGKGEEILRTNMVWKGREVWQKENLRVLAFDAALTEIGFGEPLAYGNMLVWDDEGGMVFILPEANLIDETLERLLEQTPLV